MLSIVLEINKDFLFDENISPEAKGIFLFLSYKKNHLNSVEVDMDLVKALMETEDNFILKAISELVEKKFIQIEFKSDDEMNIRLLNNDDIRKFTFGLN